ncbi:hypothetical protein TNCV_1755451 [Trichonephila clavipes]|nr:hypothetical protein TNCV_1755451 [Trichonephila clavipes]
MDHVVPKGGQLTMTTSEQAHILTSKFPRHTNMKTFSLDRFKQEARIRLVLAAALSIIQVTVRFASIPPKFRWEDIPKQWPGGLPPISRVDSTNTSSAPQPHKHYTFTNYAISRTRTRSSAQQSELQTAIPSGRHFRTLRLENTGHDFGGDHDYSATTATKVGMGYTK